MEKDEVKPKKPKAQKSQKAPNGDGSLIKTIENGKKYWKGYVTVGKKADGTPDRRGFGSKKQLEAMQKRDALFKLRDAGVVPINQTTTVTDFVLNYINKFGGDIKQISRERYIANTKNHIKIHNLGSMDYTETKAEHIQDFINFLNNQKYSTYTIINIVKPMKNAYDNAFINREIDLNPINKTIKYPRNVKKEIITYTPKEVDYLIDNSVNNPYNVAFILQFRYGMRKGEILGLSWRNINFQTNEFRINQQISRVKSGRIFTDLKTDASNRTLPLFPEIIPKLKELKAKQELIQKNNKNWNKDNLVICTKNGLPLIEKNYNEIFNTQIKKLGLPKIKVHHGRHTFTTNAINAGGDLKTVSEMLGHATIATTANTYTHSNKEKKLDLINLMSEKTK